MKMHFATAAVRALLAHSEATPRRAPTMEQLFDGRLRLDGRDLDPEDLKLGDWPTGQDIDLTRVPAGLWLVGDVGVYLMSNGRPGPPAPGDRGVATARAEETDSARHPDSWHDAKVAAFGGDDGAEFLSAAFVHRMLALGDDARCCIDLAPARMAATAPSRAKRNARKR